MKGEKFKPIEIMGQIRQVGYVDGQAKGALPNNALIRKINSLMADTHGDGTLGRIIGSIKNKPPLTHGKYMYFVEWEDM